MAVQARSPISENGECEANRKKQGAPSSREWGTFYMGVPTQKTKTEKRWPPVR